MARYAEEDTREAVRSSRSYSEALRKLGLRPVGNNHRQFRKWVDEIWQIPTGHFDPHAAAIEGLKRNAARRAVPLPEILVEGSTYKRDRLKKRLIAEGLKQNRCEMCGQDENWRGRHMALIIDHINGVRDDNRLENLQIVCPNCAATLETDCGRARQGEPPLRNCKRCGVLYRAWSHKQKYCSRECGTKRTLLATDFGREFPERRKVDRPPREQLLEEIEATSYVAVGRRYGVSDNAIRKWLRQYERER